MSGAPGGTQRVYEGPGCFSSLGDAFPGIAGRWPTVLVVHGRTSFRASGAAEIVAGVAGDDGGHVEYFGSIRENPDIETVLACREQIINLKPDILLAVGGGSAIDTAKAALGLSGADAWQSDASHAGLHALVKSGARIMKDPPHFLAAPTTAGSGSEATHFAVIYVEKKKYSLADPALRPGTVFLDPELTKSAPVSLTMASGADAVCQCVESYWAASATDESRAQALEGLRRLLPSIFSVAEDREHTALRREMLLGAHDAGKAIDLTKTTAGHALSYGLTTRFSIPHGIAVLAVMRALVPLMDAQFDFFRDLSDLHRAFGDYGSDFLAAFEQFASRVFDVVPVADKLTGATGEDLEALAGSVNIERLSNHPVSLSSDDIRAVYRRVIGV